MAGKSPNKPGLNLEDSPARKAALLRLLGSIVAVKVNPDLRLSK